MTRWLRTRRAKTPTSPSTESLADFIPRVTPRFRAPTHLAPFTNLLERAEREAVNALVSVPARHFKTETVLHFIAWLLTRHPEWTIGYASYAADLAHSKSRLARDYARAAGVRLRDDASALHEWRTVEGGGLLATGVGGPLTGHGVHVLIVDDPHKNRAEAESKRIRDHVEEWFTSTGVTRVEPGGSIFVVHTRWHPDDLIGRQRKNSEVAYDFLNLPAVSASGEALCPWRWSLAELEKKHRLVGAYDWASLYQGEPRPRGGAVFGDVVLCDERPSGLRVIIGLDFAYTSKTSSDYSVAIVLGEHDGKYYVLEVLRHQVAAPAFAAVLQGLRTRWPGARMFGYVAGPEMGVVDLLRSEPHDLPIETRAAKADKFVRAQPVAAAWNDGRVQVMRVGGDWMDPFVSEVCGFTGVGDDYDDQVDALAAGFDALEEGRGDVSLLAIPTRYT